MGNDEKYINGFLSKLSLEDINNLKNDIKLLKKKVKIHYVIDTYDIVNYTLPFNDGSLYKNIKKSETPFRYIAYEKIFGDKSKNDFYLLDEYKVELLSIKNNLENKLKTLPEANKKLLDIFQDKTDNFNLRNTKKSRNLVKKNFDFLFFLKIFIDHGQNIYDRFFGFLKNKVQVFEYLGENPKLNGIINETFRSIRPGKLSRVLFDKFVHGNSGYLLGLKSDLDRYIYLENSYRDIAAIDRLVNINRHLQGVSKTRKIVFYYLSSAPFKSNHLFEILSNSGDQLPTICDEKNFNFHRNIYQVFLYNFLEENLSDDYSKASSFLELLYEIKSMEIEGSNVSKTNKSSNEFKEITKGLNRLIYDSKTQLENSFFYSVYKDYEELKNDNSGNFKINFSKTDTFSKATNYLNNVLKKEKLFLTDMESSISSLGKIRQTYVISNKLKYIGENNLQTFVPTGDDVIKNTFHHLPYLLFYFFEDFEKRKLFFKLFDAISNFPEEIDKVSSKFSSYLQEIIVGLIEPSSNQLVDIISDFLAVCFINIITPSSDDFTKAEAINFFREREVIGALLTQKNLLAKSAIEGDLIRENEIQRLIIKEKENKLVREIDYLLVWLYRRDNKFEESNQLAKNYLLEDDDTIDCRFLHGRGLNKCSNAYYMLFQESKEIGLICELFKGSILDLKKSLNWYISESIESKSKDLRSLLVKNTIGIRNNILDSCLRLIELKQKNVEELLSEGRYQLEGIKKSFETLKHENDYLKYTTINHSEAELEYYEALFLYNKKSVEEAWFKILEASKRCFNFKKKQNFIQVQFHGIIEKIDGLRYKIFNELFNPKLE